MWEDGWEYVNYFIFFLIGWKCCVILLVNDCLWLKCKINVIGKIVFNLLFLFFLNCYNKDVSVVELREGIYWGGY